MIDHVFHRDLFKAYPIITHGQGAYLYTKDGQRYLDASSGAVAANLGHTNPEIAEAMYEQAKRVGFVHTMRFETENLHALAKKIAELAPASLNTVYFASGGSEANESAIKLVHQYHQSRGKGNKNMIIARWQSYHGNTIGSLSVGGDIKRRQLYSNLLMRSVHIDGPSPAYAYEDEEAHVSELISQLKRQINEVGADNIGAVMMESIVGSQQGAIVPPKNYFKAVQKVCRENDLLLICDEVMTGFGRTGKHFAVEHFGIEPDIITFGKGVSAGYAPLSGMIVSDQLIQAIKEYSDGKFVHGYTYSGHPVSVAAGLAALKKYEENEVLDNCQQISAYLFTELKKLQKKIDYLIDVRGKGLLIGLEFTETERSQAKFQQGNLSDAINQACMERGMILYPGSGGIDGVKGYHALVAPPLTTSKKEAEEIIRILKEVL